MAASPDVTSTSTLLIINPNSSSSITAALSASLSPFCPPNTHLTFFNPSTGPPGISDAVTATQSTEACLAELIGPNAKLNASAYDGVLVCCFSDHPLIAALSQHFADNRCKTMVLGMMHAGISNAMLLARGKFGIIATGTGVKVGHYVAIAEFLGTGQSLDPGFDSKQSARYAGSITTDLSVVELQEGNQVKVEKKMKDTTKALVDQGADIIILGCAGMCGMESWVVSAAAEKGTAVKVVDGAKAGMELLASMIRLSSRE